MLSLSLVSIFSNEHLSIIQCSTMKSLDRYLCVSRVVEFNDTEALGSSRRIRLDGGGTRDRRQETGINEWVSE